MEAERFINAGYYSSSGHTSSFASPSPQGTQTCSHSHVGTNAQRRVLTPAGRSSGLLRPKAHAGTGREAARSSASLFFPSVLHE